MKEVMKKSDKDKFLRYLVKSFRNIPEHPGYLYEYFLSFEELDAYFCNETGDNWKDQEWVRVFLNQPTPLSEDAMIFKRSMELSVKADIDGKAV